MVVGTSVNFSTGKNGFISLTQNKVPHRIHTSTLQCLNTNGLGLGIGAPRPSFVEGTGRMLNLLHQTRARVAAVFSSSWSGGQVWRGSGVNIIFYLKFI